MLPRPGLPRWTPGFTARAVEVRHPQGRLATTVRRMNEERGTGGRGRHASTVRGPVPGTPAPQVRAPQRGTPAPQVRAPQPGTPQPGRRRVGALGVLAALTVLVAACTSTSTAGTPPGDVMRSVVVPGAPLPEDGPAPTGWQGLDGLSCATRAQDTTVVKVAQDTALDQAWATYGDTGAGWTGGDSVHAYAVGRSEVLWAFADSFLGPIGPGGTRPPTEPLIHSLFVRQSGDRFSTVTGGSAGRPVALVRPHQPHAIYLTLGGLRSGDRLQEFLLEDHTSPSGAVAEEPAGTLLATYALPSLRRLSLQPLAHESATILWGAAVTRIGDHTYVYGATAAGNDKALYVARVEGTDLAGAWQYWDGHGWSADPAAVAAIDTGVSPEVSVTDVDGMIVLVTTPTTSNYSPFIAFGTACSPTGPFRLAAVIRASYATGSVGVRYYGVDDVYVYDAADEPDFNRGSTWLISFDQNVLRYSDLAGNVAIYRPSYLWVQLGPRAGSGA